MILIIKVLTYVCNVYIINIWSILSFYMFQGKGSILIFSVRITGVLLDCAPQKNEYHDFKNGKWSPKMEILEPYEEGCSEVDDKGERTTATKYVI